MGQLLNTTSWMHTPEILPSWVCYSNKEELTGDVIMISALLAVTTRQKRSGEESRLLVFHRTGRWDPMGGSSKG